MESKQTVEKKEGWFSSSSFKAAGNQIGKGVAVVGAGMAVAGAAVAATAGGITLIGFTSSGIAAGFLCSENSIFHWICSRRFRFCSTPIDCGPRHCVHGGSGRCDSRNGGLRIWRVQVVSKREQHRSKT